MSITIGPYVEGEVPEPIEYQFLDADSAPIDLTGFTATFSLGYRTTAGQSLDADVSTPDEGRVTYVWRAGDLMAGHLRAEFVATNGTNTYYSDRMNAVVAAPIEVA